MSGMRVRAKRDEAASPVIGVIMMVGTTVVIAASVYAWTGSYANVPEQSVHVVGLVGNERAEGGLKTYTVAAVMPGILYADLGITVDGAAFRMVTDKGCPDPAPGEYVVCLGEETLRPRDAVTAGDTVKVHAHHGQTLRVVDHASGAVVLQMTVT